jgi:hypothetical protein
MAQPLWQAKPGVEFKPAANITSIYEIMSREQDRLNANDRGADENVVNRAMGRLAGKRAICRGEFAGQIWIIG